MHVDDRPERGMLNRLREDSAVTLARNSRWWMFVTAVVNYYCVCSWEAGRSNRTQVVVTTGWGWCKTIIPFAGLLFWGDRGFQTGRGDSGTRGWT